MHKQIDVTGLPDPLIEAIESIVRTYRNAIAPEQERREKRRIGWMRGKLQIPDSFFDPLPDDLLDLFEGKGNSEI
jgi:hypothetical protein